MQIAFVLSLLARLTLGVLAAQAPDSPVPQARAARYAVAAYDASLRYGIDPFELIGTAANESNFDELAIGPDGLDCGITQTRVTGSRYSCWRLRHDVHLAFAEAGRELREDADSCRGRWDENRCRLNRYNSGWNYARQGFVGAYWLRTTCFANAARSGHPPRGGADSCRRVYSYRDIARLTGMKVIEALTLSGPVLASSPLIPPRVVGIATGRPRHAG